MLDCHIITSITTSWNTLCMFGNWQFYFSKLSGPHISWHVLTPGGLCLKCKWQNLCNGNSRIEKLFRHSTTLLVRQSSSFLQHFVELGIDANYTKTKAKTCLHFSIYFVLNRSWRSTGLERKFVQSCEKCQWYMFIALPTGHW